MPTERTAKEIREEWRGKQIALKNGVPCFKSTGNILHLSECREALIALLFADYEGEVIF